jgi:hypothetical protein
MPGWLFLVAFLVVYLVLTQWLLPKPGGSHLKERIPAAEEVYVPRGDHMLAGCEQEVVEKIIQWV